jgi:eukaryotic-like serine/threonine-protein kinase
MEKANEVYRQWAQEYPNENGPHVNLALNYEVMGEFDKAATQSLIAIDVAPSAVTGYADLMAAYLALNRVDEALAIYQKAKQQGFDNEYLREMRYAIAFLENDQAELQRQLQAARELPGAEAGLQGLHSEVEAVGGHLQKSREATERAVAAAQRDGSPEGAAVWLANAAYREALFGNTAEARKQIEQALSIAPGRDVQIAAGLTFAEIGDSAQAQKYVDKLAADYPLDTLMQSYWLPSIRATMALHKTDANRAVLLLEVATPYELGLENIGSMVPIYIRGVAYLKAGKGAEATAELKKILAHRGVAQTGAVQSLAQLQLARALAASGDKPAARVAYQDLLSIWKQADPDLLLLKQAQSEYDHLKN